MVAAHTQLRLTREAAADLRRPREKPTEPARLTPARVRRGLRNLRPHLHYPARVPKPSMPCPGRPVVKSPGRMRVLPGGGSFTFEAGFVGLPRSGQSVRPQPPIGPGASLSASWHCWIRAWMARALARSFAADLW